MWDVVVTPVSAHDGLSPGSFSFLTEKDVFRCTQRNFWFAYGFDSVDGWDGHVSG